MKYSFDSKCFDLAEHFLPREATTAVKNELAQTIQNAVEDWFGSRPVAPPKRDCTCIPPKFCAVCA
jgi:hypothetical protein